MYFNYSTTAQDTLFKSTSGNASYVNRCSGSPDHTRGTFCWGHIESNSPCRATMDCIGQCVCNDGPGGLPFVTLSSASVVGACTLNGISGKLWRHDGPWDVYALCVDASNTPVGLYVYDKFVVANFKNFHVGPPAHSPWDERCVSCQATSPILGRILNRK